MVHVTVPGLHFSLVYSPLQRKKALPLLGEHVRRQGLGGRKPLPAGNSSPDRAQLPPATAGTLLTAASCVNWHLLSS